ncbi:MAG: methyltransferase domain-containing protein [Flavobacteriales bacterium]|nr:methyltransferase domain-containing protein [Flavobacteriales bacterium]
MSDSWDDYAEDWDANSDVIDYAQKAFDSLCPVIDLDGLRVLDFGCGTGLLTEKIATLAATVLAIDSSSKMIEVLSDKRLTNVNVLAYDITDKAHGAKPILAAEFDLIVASSVFSFVPNYEQTLTVLKSLLKPSGLLVQWDWKSTDSAADLGFTEKAIRDCCSNVGFTLVELNTAFSQSSKRGSTDVIMAVAKNT